MGLGVTSMTKLRSVSFLGHLNALLSGGTLTGLGEGQLLERFLAERDETAFAELIARHGPMVVGICRRWLDDPQDVEDAFQATFLVLVRKAATLNDRDTLANWLHGVSLRVARRARAERGRRSRRERLGLSEAANVSTTSDGLASREVLTIVDQEIRRLPERQQAAVVLCLVQGRTHDAAARELGWPIGTVKSRLATARATLKRRLSRRGVAPSLILGLGHAAERFSADPTRQDIARRTIEAAMQIATSPSTQGVDLSASVATLVQGVLRTLFLSRLKLAAVGLTAIVALAWAMPSFLPARPAVPPEIPVSATPPNAARDPVRPARVDLYGDPLPPGASVRLGTIRNRQESPIYKIAYSPDGKYIVTDGDDEKLRVWDADSGRLIRQIDSGKGWRRDFAISRDNKLLAADVVRVKDKNDDILTIAVNDLETSRRVLQKSSGVAGGGLVFKLSADGARLALDSSDGIFRVLDTATGAECCALKLGGFLYGPIAFAPMGDRCAVAGHQELYVIDVDQKKATRISPAFSTWPHGLGFSADGTKLIGFDISKAGLWDISTARGGTFELYPASAMALSADGHRVAGFNEFGDLAIWKVASFGPHLAMQRGILHSTNFGVMGWDTAAFSPNGRALATNGGKPTLRIWDIATKRDKLAILEAHSGWVNSILVTSNGKTAITSSPDATVRLWDLESARQLRSLKLLGYPRTIALSPDQRWLLATSYSNEGVYAWDLQDSNAPAIISTEISGYWPLAARFLEPNNAIQVYWSDGRVRRLDLQSCRLTVEKDISASAVGAPIASKDTFTAGCFVSAGRRLVVNGITHGLLIADIESGKVLSSVPETDLFAVSCDERLIAVSKSRYSTNDRITDGRGASRSTGGEIDLLDSETGREKLHIDIAGSGVWAMAFAPDGRTLAATTGWDQGQIHLYDTLTAKEFKTIATPALRTSGLTFTPDGSRLIAGMADTSVLVWDLRDIR